MMGSWSSQRVFTLLRRLEKAGNTIARCARDGFEMMMYRNCKGSWPILRYYLKTPLPFWYGTRLLSTESRLVIWTHLTCLAIYDSQIDSRVIAFFFWSSYR